VRTSHLLEWTFWSDGKRPCGRGPWRAVGQQGAQRSCCCVGVLADPGGRWMHVQVLFNAVVPLSSGPLREQEAGPGGVSRVPSSSGPLREQEAGLGGVSRVPSSSGSLRELEAEQVGSHASLRFPEERWSSYCLTSLAAQSICTSKLHCSATPGQADRTGSLGSTSCCSLLRGLSPGWSTPLLPAPVCNPNKAVFTVDAKTAEVRASGCDPAARLGSAASAYGLRRAPRCVSTVRRKAASASAVARAMTLETSV